MDTGGNGEARDDARPFVTPPRLLDALDRVLRTRVAVVSGPAGHGKKGLVHAWLEAHPELESRWIAAPQELDEVEPARNPSELRVLVVARPKLLADSTFVSRALELAERDPSIRLVFAGRSRPDAPLGSLAARGLLVNIETDQLALTRDEVAQLLTPDNPDLPEFALDTIMESSGGWPAVVQMLTGETLTWAHSSSAVRLADSYLVDEVLSGLDEQDIALLQELSPLPTLDPLAAAWMTGRGDAAAQLSRLQAHGVPITWDDANTIRLNPLLRAHLGRQLARERPEEHAHLIERASLWLRNRQRPMEAMGLAMQAGLLDLAWMIAGEFITINMDRPNLVHSMPELVELLPPGWEIDIVRSISRGMATPQTMVAQMSAIDPQLLVERNDTGRLGYVALALGMVRKVGYPCEVDVSLALEIAGSLDARGIHELDHALLAAVHTEYGLYLLHHGRLAEANEQLLAGLGLARVVNVPWATVCCLSALSYLNAEQGAVDSSHRLADEAILTGSDTVFSTDSLDEFAILGLALTAVDTGDLASARRWLDTLDQHAELLRENDAFRTHVRCAVAVMQGDPAQALRLVEAFRDEAATQATEMHAMLVGVSAVDAAITLGDVALAEHEYQQLMHLDLPEMGSRLVVLQARIFLARGDARAAHEMLRPLAEGQVQLEHPKDTLYSLMIFGVAADELHRPDEALRAFQRAGVLAERLGLDTPQARHTTVAVASRQEVPLTTAERHVLEHLDASKTLGETAEELFISLNTLKTHLRRVYKKLGVANREEAIDRARVMGLRPRTD